MTILAIRPGQRTAAASHEDPPSRPQLRTELFLVSHDESTGLPHIDKGRLENGLAAAVLLDLWLSEHIAIGWRYDARYGPWQPDPGRITLLKETPTGDPLLDSALELLARTASLRIRDFIRAFRATGGLYERIRGDMTAHGLLRVTHRRRFLFFTQEVYRPRPEYPVRARARLRYLVTHRRRVPGNQEQYAPALAGLVTALGLTSYLYPPEMSATALHQKLSNLVYGLPDPTVRDVTSAVLG
jgi:hypothetical protein